MSSNLYWEQVKPVRGKMFKSDDETGLKITLREEYGYPLDTSFTKKSIPMLRGLKIGTKYKSVDELIELIEKYGEVRLWEEG